MQLAHRVSAGHSVSAPSNWQEGSEDPRRPYPTDGEMRAGLLARLEHMPALGELSRFTGALAQAPTGQTASVPPAVLGVGLRAGTPLSGTLLAGTPLSGGLRAATPLSVGLRAGTPVSVDARSERVQPTSTSATPQSRSHPPVDVEYMTSESESESSSD